VDAGSILGMPAMRPPFLDHVSTAKTAGPATDAMNRTAQIFFDGGDDPDDDDSFYEDEDDDDRDGDEDDEDDDSDEDGDDDDVEPWHVSVSIPRR
jgi:hypothetical protein